MNSVRIFLLLLTTTIVGCGGGSDVSSVSQSTPVVIPVVKPLLTCSMSPTSHLVQYEGDDCSIYTTSEKNMFSSFQLQQQAKGDLVLWGGFTKKSGFNGLELLVDLASTDKRFKYGYVYDEMFLELEGVSLGAKEQEITQAAAYVRSKGIKAVVSFVPEIVLMDDFKLKDANFVDILALDPYPAAVLYPDKWYGPLFRDNHNTHVLYYSIKKLKDSGFIGNFWYIYQAFYVEGTPHEVILDQFKKQRETLALAQSFGVTGVVAFGWELGEEELKAEINLRQGKGSLYEEAIGRIRPELKI